MTNNLKLAGKVKKQKPSTAEEATQPPPKQLDTPEEELVPFPESQITLSERQITENLDRRLQTLTKTRKEKTNEK